MFVFLKNYVHVADTTLACILLGQHRSFPVQILMNLLLLVIHLITGNEWIVINLPFLKEKNKIFPFSHIFLDCLMFLWLLMVDDYYLW